MVIIILLLDIYLNSLKVLWCCIFLSQNSKKLQQSEKDIMIGDVGWHLGKCHSIKIVNRP